MRNVFLALCSVAAAFALVSGLAGCAQQREDDLKTRAMTAPPTDEQLPSIEETANPYPASVGVPRAPNEPRVVFVPKFEPIEQTPEEREALGIREPTIDFLEFYRPEPGWEDRRTLPWDMLPVTAIYREGTHVSINVPAGPPVSHAAQDHTGVFGYSLDAGQRSFAYPGATPVWGFGLDPTPIVGYIPGERRSNIQPLRDP